MESSPSTGRSSNPQEAEDHVSSNPQEAEDHVLTHDVFLSHSGAQKNVVRQLHVDLRRHNISSFFDQDNQSLPKGKKFTTRIFENIDKCKVAVVVLSCEFLKSKWPMLELSRMFEARERNQDLHILPLFYRISHEDFRQKLEKYDFKEEWENIKKEDKNGWIDLEKWRNSLKSIRDCKALHRSECKYITDVDYRESIVNEVVRLLPPNRLFDVSHVEGKDRLCSEVDRMLNELQEARGVKLLGLHGIGGCGKTAVCKCLCNFYEAEFKGKVFYIDLGKGIPVETYKQLLQVVGNVEGSALDQVSTKDQVFRILQDIMYDKVFLALDGLYGEETEVMEDVRSFLVMTYKEGSKIVVTSRYADNFECGRLRPAEIPSVCVSRLEDYDATNILLKNTDLYGKELSSQLQERLKIYTMNCVFSDAYNPSALKKLGEYLCENFGSDPKEWEVIPNLAELRWLAEKIYWYYELMMWYLRIGNNYPRLYLGINLLLGKVFFKEFKGILFILVRALLTAFLSTTGIGGFVSTIMDILRSEEVKELLDRLEWSDLFKISTCLLSARNSARQ